MHRGMSGNPVKNPGQDLPLQVFESRLWRFNQANSARAFRLHPVMIMAQLRRAFPIHESLQAGEPVQFTRIEPEPFSQRAHVLKGRDIPGCGRRNRLHPLRLG